MTAHRFSRVLLGLSSVLAALSFGVVSPVHAAASSLCASTSSSPAVAGDGRSSVTLTACWLEQGLVELRVARQGSQPLERLVSAVPVYSTEGSSLLLRRQPVVLGAERALVRTYAVAARPGVSALGLYSSLIVDWAGDGAPAERVAVRLMPPGV